MSFRCETGVSLRPYKGLQSCGDSAVVRENNGVSVFALIDALGHGPDAAKSAKALAAHIEANVDRPMRDIFDRAAKALQGLRGAVMSMIRVDQHTAVFAGVGNVELYGPPGVSRPITSPGVLGGAFKLFKEQTLPIESGQRWVLASDGLKARDLPKGLEQTRSMPPSDAAAKLIELAGRDNDDAGVVVIDFWEQR